MAQHGFGIIGCGMIAEFHTRAINEIDDARVVGACSRNRGQRRKDRRNGGRTPARLSTTSIRCSPSPVSTSSASARPAALTWNRPCRAAEAGKHVVVEKPLEITLPRCDAIIAACERAGVRLCTIFPSRFTAANRRLKEAIDLGRFGRLTLGDTYVKWWRTQEYYDSGGWRGTWRSTAAAPS